MASAMVSSILVSDKQREGHPSQVARALKELGGWAEHNVERVYGDGGGDKGASLL
jgi:hypothetical protein